jgi:hypothetical protein
MKKTTCLILMFEIFCHVRTAYVWTWSEQYPKLDPQSGYFTRKTVGNETIESIAEIEYGNKSVAEHLRYLNHRLTEWGLNDSLPEGLAILLPQELDELGPNNPFAKKMPLVKKKYREFPYTIKLLETHYQSRFRHYIYHPQETLGMIAERNYGNKRFWKMISSANMLTNVTDETQMLEIDYHLGVLWIRSAWNCHNYMESGCLQAIAFIQEFNRGRWGILEDVGDFLYMEYIQEPTCLKF